MVHPCKLYIGIKVFINLAIKLFETCECFDLNYCTINIFVKIVSIKLELPGFEGRALGAFMPPFEVWLDPLSPQCEFHGVIAQDGELVHIGDYITHL